MIGEKGRGDFSYRTEATLFEQAQGGCAASLNELMQRHEKLVHFVVQRQWLFTLPYEEAVQAGRRWLWRAILGYDGRRGRAFSTYAYVAIMKYVWAAVKAEQRRLQREVPLAILVRHYYRTGDDPAGMRAQQEIAESLQALVWLRQPAHSQELRSLLERHNVRQYELADELAQAWLKRRGGRHGRH